MIKKSIFTAIACLLVSFSSVAQLPEKVGSLLSVDRNAATLSNQGGPHQGLSSIIDKESTFFVPSPVNAFNYLNNRPNLPDRLSWSPNFAAVAKSLDWGVTSGSMDFQKIGAVKRQGQYVTVWRRDRKGNWRVHIRAEVNNFGSNTPAPLKYIEPDNRAYLKQRSKVRLNQREEVVLQTDNLMSTVMRANTQSGYREFLAEDARFYFPWLPETEGRDKIVALLKKERIEIDTEPSGVGRAYSGELAYTSGTATVGHKDKVMKFSYIRIWQLMNDYEWKVILEMMYER